MRSFLATPCKQDYGTWWQITNRRKFAQRPPATVSYVGNQLFSPLNLNGRYATNGQKQYRLKELQFGDLLLGFGEGCTRALAIIYLHLEHTFMVWQKAQKMQQHHDLPSYSIQPKDIGLASWATHTGFQIQG